ncbi:MAG: DUF1573 domain-containing protein [Sedimentisphaerales bacterium]
MIYKIGNTIRLINMLIVTVIFVLLCPIRVSTGLAVNIPFNGTASGGKLVIGYIPDSHSVHISNISIDTTEGESAESVVKHLAEAITTSDAIFSKITKNPANAELMRKEMSQENTLIIRGLYSDYILAGTETGLGIPKPPLYLSAYYDKKANTIDVKWINPSGNNQYDSLAINWSYRNYAGDTFEKVHGGSIWDTPRHFTIKLPEDINDISTDIWIRGYRHEIPIKEMRVQGLILSDNVIPSDAAAISISSNGYSMEETNGIPFFEGIAPNWSAWSYSPKIDFSDFEQGEKYAGVRRYQPTKSLSTKPYYQIIKAPFGGVAHGVYRKFIGLTSGHTYRLTACLSTMEMDSIKKNWSYSLYVTTNPPDGKNLTPEQMAGKASLPNGEKGPDAGQICYFDPNNTTKGNFVYAITDYSRRRDGTISSNITLPNNVNEITVWTKFICEDNSGKVVFSGVKLEDITSIQKPKEPQQIIMEEQESEIELLKWIQENQKVISNERVRKIVPSKLTFKNNNFNLGDIKPNSTNTAVFNFTNDSNEPLVIKDVTKCCGAIIKLDKNELAPGEYGTLTVEYRTGIDTGIFRRGIGLITNEPNCNPIGLTITGTVIQTLKWEPKSFEIFSFGQDMECPEITIKSLNNTSFSIQNFASSGNCFYADFNPNYTATEIILKPKINLEKLRELTSNRGSIVIELNHPDYKTITLNFDIVPSLQVTPAQILVFNADMNEPITKSIVLQDNQNQNNANIFGQIESIISENGSKVEILKSAMVDKKCEFDLKITPKDNKNTESHSKDNIVIKMKDGRRVSVPLIKSKSYIIKM